MALAAGARLGPYEIVATLGAGGMGEVYRARDTRLDRTVAIKVLPAALASDPQFLERFDREARAISALEHPHVCALYDVGQHHGYSYLVMQFLEGETLADRVARARTLALPEALQIGIQIADALDAAHRRGIVHRDLKPGNVMLTKGGVKLLDFGLAKSRSAMAASASVAETQPRPLTAEGTILGTLSYMAPEQIEGDDADARADIWALGCVLYEMLTGARPFRGQSSASVIGSILRDVPPPVSRTVTLSPPALDRAVAKCLAKDPDGRWQSAADLRDELRWVGDHKAGPASGRPRRWGRRLAIMFGGALLILAAMVGLGLWIGAQRSSAPARTTRFSIALPPHVTFEGAPAVSPDGTRVVFVGRQAGRDALWLREIDELAPRRLEGTVDALLPFWSPDSRSIGFFANGRLMRIDADGGTPRTLCDAPTGRGATWGRDGTILFAPEVMGALLQVPANGGSVTAATRLDANRQDNSHRFPHFLPDGRHFLFTNRTGDVKTTGVYVASLDDPAPRWLLAADSGAVYAGGYLLFARENTLLAQRFDLDRRELAGSAVSLIEPIGYDFARTRGYFSASDTGVLVYYPGGGNWSPTGTFRLTWFTRSGRQDGTIGEAGLQFNPALSPDGRQLVFDRLDARTGARSVWIGDVERNIVSRVTLGDSFATTPLWSRDGASILFLSIQRERRALYIKPAGGGASEQLFAEGESLGVPTSWSADGRRLVFQRAGEGTRTDIWMLPLDGAREPVPFLVTPFDETQAQFSPDGRWIVYTSDESGQYEVYVRNYPADDQKIRVSSAGGGQPQWRRDGRELYYLSLDQAVVAVPIVQQRGGLMAGAPQRLFPVGLAVSIPRERNGFVPDATGQRFLVSASQEQFDKPLVVVQNWIAALPK